MKCEYTNPADPNLEGFEKTRSQIHKSVLYVNFFINAIAQEMGYTPQEIEHVPAPQLKSDRDKYLDQMIAYSDCNVRNLIMLYEKLKKQS